MGIYRFIFSLIFILLPGLFAQAQQLELYRLTYAQDESTGFVSLSDNYRLSDHPDSLAVPISEINRDSVQFITLSSVYRKRFLDGTNLSEDDKVFIYNFEKEKFVELEIRNLKVIAVLSVYTTIYDWPFSPYDFQIGFKIDASYLAGFSDYYSNTLVYAGRENVFIQNQLNRIEWRVIESTEFPNQLISEKYASIIKEEKLELTNCHEYSMEEHNYYLQTFKKNGIDYAKQLVVVHKASKSKIYERFYMISEGSSFAPDNNQWTGSLFKDRPPVIFGFQYHSFGCESIPFIDTEMKENYISCDNRH